MGDYADETEIAAEISGGDVGEPAAAPETPPEIASADAPAEPAEESAPWAGPSQDEWQAFQAQQTETQQALAWLIENGARPQGDPAAQQAEEPPEYDPFDPESVQAYIDWLTDQKVDARLGPYQAGLAASSEQQAETQVSGWLQQAQVPDQDREAVVYASYGMLPRDQQGNVIPGYGEQAIRYAAQYVADRDKQVGERAVEEYKKQETLKREQLSNLAGAPSNPAGPSGVDSVYRDGDDEVTVARRWREQQLAQ